MKKFLFFASLVSFCNVYSQFSVNVESSPAFTAKEAILYSLNGSKDIIEGREIRKGNTWKFTVPKKYSGMMKIYFPETNSAVNLISENRDVRIKLIADDSKVNDVVYLDEANLLMEKMQDTQRKNELIFLALVQIKEYYKNNTEFGSALQKEIQRLGEKTEINSAKNPFIAFYNTNYNKFLVENSAIPAASEEEIISFLSNSGEMLETSSILRPLLVAFLNKGGNSNLEGRIDKLLTRVNVETPRGQTVLSELIGIFDVYGMPELKDKYLSQAKQLKCTINDRLASTIKANAAVELGAVFPDYKFTSVQKNNAKSIHAVKADKKVVVFWSSTCSHCEKELPELLAQYNKMKESKIEIIGLSMDDNKDSYQKRVSTLPWINDSELRGWNASYAEIYNVNATPTYFILDASNKIIAKPDHASDVLKFLNLK